MNNVWKYETKRIEEVLNLLDKIELRVGIVNSQKMVRVFELLSSPLKDEKENEEITE
jgi:hypothetical protein